MLLTDKQKDHLVSLLNTWVDNCIEHWEKPWAATSAYDPVPPMNFATKKGYGLMNYCMLLSYCEKYNWSVPYFITYEKGVELGLLTRTTYQSGQGEPVTMRKVRNGEDSSEIEGMVLETGNVVFQRYVQYYLKDVGKPIDFNQKPLSYKKYMELTEEERENYRPVKHNRGTYEFNIEQTNFPDLYPEAWEQLKASVKAMRDKAKAEPTENVDVRIDALDKVLTVEGGWRCPIKHDGGSRAYYVPSNDDVHLPKPEYFVKRSKYYSTALHELAHSTKKPLHRDYGSKGFGSAGYAQEELVAELTAAFVSAHYHVEVTHDPDNPLDQEHLAYVKGWRTACKDPKNVIGRIFDDIMDAVQYETNYIDYVDDRIEAYRKKNAAKAA